MSRDEIQVALMGKAASTKLHGVYLGSGSQVLDNTTVIRHQNRVLRVKKLLRRPQ